MRLATVKVRFELEVDVYPSWGSDCTLGQITEQACSKAMGSVSSGLQPMLRAGHVRIVSKPEAVAVMAPIGTKP